MRMRGTGILIMAGALLFSAGERAAAEEPTSPPTNLKLVGDHWTPWDPPTPTADSYIIKKGDTLWDLSREWFDDPFLWPQIWDENRYILDSHWIYPGDPLTVPGRPTVVTEAPTDASSGRQDAGGFGRLPGADRDGDDDGSGMEAIAAAPVEVPAADASELYCAGFIAQDLAPADLFVAGRETERIASGQGDVIFLSSGKDAGIRAGDEFALVRRTDNVAHPVTGDSLGRYVRRLGRARVLISHDRSATALIDMACEEVLDGDELMAWEEIAIPMLEEVPEFNRLDAEPSGGPTGHVVWQRDALSIFGQGDVIFTDLGRISGASPGDFVRLYRERTGDLPRMPLAHGVVLTVGPDTSAVKLMYSTRESGIGDEVELLR